MKRLLALSCLFSAGLFAREDVELTAALKRADVQFAECIRARGENKRTECQKERNSLRACMHAESVDRMQRAAQHVNLFVRDEYAPADEYSRAVSNIHKQYDECVRARGRNQLFECIKERDGLLKNASKEYAQSLRDEGLVSDLNDHTNLYDDSEINWNYYPRYVATALGVGIVFGVWLMHPRRR